MHLLDLPPWFLSLLLAPFGLVVGSFGNVLIHRLPKGEGVVLEPSHCPSCGMKIKPWQNIPLLSWLLLRGKCANCGWRIPFRYPLVELLGGLVFAGSVWVLPVGTLIWLKGLICGIALVVLFFTDLTEMILPDLIQLPLILLGVLMTLPQLRWPDASITVVGREGMFLASSLWHNGLQAAPHWDAFGLPVTWKESLLGAVIGYGVPALLNQIYRLIRKTDGLGMGDFKMLAWLGAFWGWGPMLGILFLGALLGSLVGLPLMFTRREGGRLMLPFGCFLALATGPVVFYGARLWEVYLGLMQ